MRTLSQKIALRFVKLLNVLLMLIPFAMCYGKYVLEIHGDQNEFTFWLVMAFFVFLYMTYARIYECFAISRSRVSEIIHSQCLALLMTNALLYIVLCLMAYRFLSPLMLILAAVIQMLLSVCWSIAAHVWYIKSFPPRRTAIIYDQQRNVEPLVNIYGLEKKFRVEQTVTVDEYLQRGASSLEGMETVFLCGIHSHERNIILKHCVRNQITVYVLPRIGDVIMGSARRTHLFHLPFLQVARYDPAPEYLLMKRLFDMVASGLALVILSPVMLITAVAIKRCDGGPVLYRQTRLTKDGKAFQVLKFRSMWQDAEKDGVARLSTGEQDERITPVGRVIRKFRIDEIPQLINILQGSMSIVGPRPERPEIAMQYEEQLPEFSLRLQAKAGLTGYAQVYGKYNTTPYDKLQMDLMYIASPSFLEDLRIIFATIKILFVTESTEGVPEGMETAMEENK